MILYDLWLQLGWCLHYIIPWHGLRRKHHFQQFLYCCAWTLRFLSWSLLSSLALWLLPSSECLSRCLFRGLC
jgi:hypothetical protein